jgi:leucine dehydrogenase
VVAPDAVLSLEVDVLAPCAMGAVFNDETLPGIRAAIVCGGANNQLDDDRHGEALHQRGILFVPDYVANSGGVISGAAGLMGLGEEEARRRAAEIYDTCTRVFERAERDRVSTSLAAEAMAREVVEAAAARKD